VSLFALALSQSMQQQPAQCTRFMSSIQPISQDAVQIMLKPEEHDTMMAARVYYGFEDPTAQQGHLESEDEINKLTHVIELAMHTVDNMPIFAAELHNMESGKQMVYVFEFDQDNNGQRMTCHSRIKESEVEQEQAPQQMRGGWGGPRGGFGGRYMGGYRGAGGFGGYGAIPPYGPDMGMDCPEGSVPDQMGSCVFLQDGSGGMGGYRGYRNRPLPRDESRDLPRSAGFQERDRERERPSAGQHFACPSDMTYDSASHTCLKSQISQGRLVAIASEPMEISRENLIMMRDLGSFNLGE